MSGLLSDVASLAQAANTDIGMIPSDIWNFATQHPLETGAALLAAPVVLPAAADALAGLGIGDVLGAVGGVIAKDVPTNLNTVATVLNTTGIPNILKIVAPIASLGVSAHILGGKGKKKRSKNVNTRRISSRKKAKIRKSKKA